MMGDAEATQKHINRLAKREFFLPKEVHEPRMQIETAVFLIEKITTKRGIASATYRKGLECFNDNLDHFMTRAHKDDLYLNKFCYYLDMIKQSIFSKRLEHCSNKNPLLRAKKKKLSGFVDVRIQRFVTGMEIYVVLNIGLPSSLPLANKEPNPKTPKRGNTGGSDKDKTPD